MPPAARAAKGQNPREVLNWTALVLGRIDNLRVSRIPEVSRTFQ